MKLFVQIIAALLSILTAVAAGTIQSNTGGKWDSTGTWKGGIIPSDTDIVVILAGHTVTVNVDNPIVEWLTVKTNGVLQFDGVKNRIISSKGDIIVEAGGKITPSGTFNTGDALNNIQLKGNLIVDGAIEYKKLGILSGSRTINYINFQPSAVPGRTTIEGNGTVGAAYLLIGKSAATDTVTVKPGVSVSVQNIDLVKGILDNSLNNITVTIVSRYDNASTLTAKPKYNGAGYASYLGYTNITAGVELPDTVGNIFLQNGTKQVFLSKNVVVLNYLFLNDGKLNTGAYTVKVNGSVSNPGKGYVIGALEKPVSPLDTIRTFEIGTENGYSEISMHFHKLIGSIMPHSIVARTFRQMHPALKDSLSALRRYWTLTAKGGFDFLNYDVTVRYAPSDFVNSHTEKNDENSLLIAKYNPTISVSTPQSWEIPKLDPLSRDTSGAGGTVTAMGLTGFAQTGAVEYTLIKEPSALSVHPQPNTVPAAMQLVQNYPNPFNPSTTLGFTLQISGLVTLKIYDALGREASTLVNENLEAGVYHERIFDASHCSSGIYFARLTGGGITKVMRMMLVK
ncbi:MAG: T9SS type A sorting domain-containing protein [Bacteroidota bacterium]